MTEPISYGCLQKMWEKAAEDRTEAPSVGMASLGTFRYIAAKYPDRKLRPDVQALLDDPALSDSVVIKICGGRLWVYE